jgi:toxin FitB
VDSTSIIIIIIIAVAGSNDRVVVTDSERDFVGLRIVNPMREGAS